MKSIKKMVWSAFFLALGLILPFLTGQIPEIGNKLLPMHIPVLLCGFICGWKYGLLVGFITPLLRCFLFSIPVPAVAAAMAFELATYGTVVGILYQGLRERRARTYISLFIAMIAGRLIWGATSVIICGISQTAFTWQMFMGGALLNAIPGVILQMVLIPILMLALEKSGVMENADR